MFFEAYVDDTDTSIRYDDGWTLSRTTAIVGQFGPPLYSTLHIATGPAQFSYKFTGNSIDVKFPISQGNSNAPEFNCTVDGILWSKPNAYTSPISTSCFEQRLPGNGTHELAVSVVGTHSNPVMFDYITYSGPQALMDADFMHVGIDEAVSVSAPNSSNSSAFPLPPGATLNIAFDGYSIGLYVAISFLDSHAPSFASYTVDGGNPTNFTIANPISNSDTGTGVFSLLVLQTPRYPVGKHNLEVKFLGTKETTPPFLSSYVIQNSSTNGVFPEATPAVASDTPPLTYTSTSSASTSSSQSESKPYRTHPMIWRLVAAAVSITLLLFFRRRRKRFMNRLSGTIVNSFEHGNMQRYTGKHGLQRREDVLVVSKSDSRGITSLGTDSSLSTTQFSPERILIHEDSEEVISEPGNDILELSPTYANASRGAG